MGYKNEEQSALHLAAGHHLDEEKLVNIKPLAEIERAYIKKVMTICGNDAVRAAELLGIPVSDIYNK